MKKKWIHIRLNLLPLVWMISKISWQKITAFTLTTKTFLLPKVGIKTN